jgi:hypothetical protein
VRVAAYLALAALCLMLWFYLAAEKTPEIDPETGWAIPEISQAQESPGFRAWLGW